MKELTFDHDGVVATYEKAMLKFTKMLDTETGRKFFAHLVKAFLQSGTARLVDHVDDPTGIIQCDLTHTKLVSSEEFEKFKAIYKAKIAGFTKLEGETDDMFEARRDAYVMAFRSSNPYACDGCLAYTADKTDKVLCAEALNALIAKKNEVEANPDKYPEVIPLIKVWAPRKKVKKGKYQKDKKTNSNQDQSSVRKGGSKKKGFYTTGADHSATLGDNPAFAKLKAKFS
jgi:hypothetical protein